MALLQINNLCVHLGDRTLLDNVNMMLGAGEHIGLVGRNGCGKSTLLKMIAGLTDLPIDSGNIHIPTGISVGYLHQDHNLEATQSLFDAACGKLINGDELANELGDLAVKMGEVDGDEFDAVMERYQKIEDRLAHGGGNVPEHVVTKTLLGLGLNKQQFDIPCGKLSGGQRARVALARLLISQPDILLLDEPTNHLDIAGRQWLEEYITNYAGAVILISHDRWLLNRAVSAIVELERGELISYPGHYDKFRELRAARLDDQRRLFDKQQAHIAKERDFIERFRAGQRSKQARGRETRLERMLETEILEMAPELAAMHLQFRPKTRSGDIVVQCEEMSMAFSDNHLFSDLSFTLKRGDRLGIIGANGTGKSTLLRCMMGEYQPTQGQIKLGAQVDIGYFRQDHSHLPMDQSIVEVLGAYVPEQNEQAARNLAGAFLFSGDDQDKQLGSLSGGERARVALACMMIEGHNLLILDEPTNHLDIPSTERLEQALQGYINSKTEYSTSGRNGGEGTLVLISHDRMLLDDLVNQLLIFHPDGTVEHFLGTYSEWTESRGHDVLHDTTSTKAISKDKMLKAIEKPAEKAAPAPSAAKPAAAKNNKKRSTAYGGLSQGRLEEKIAQLQTIKDGLNQQLADPNLYANKDKFEDVMAELECTQKDLDTLEEEWLSRDI